MTKFGELRSDIPGGAPEMGRHEMDVPVDAERLRLEVVSAADKAGVAEALGLAAEDEDRWEEQHLRRVAMKLAVKTMGEIKHGTDFEGPLFWRAKAIATYIKTGELPEETT